MRYTINIDQEFAVMHDMTLTEVSCLAACFTLPTWSESYYIENKTWYWYSEKKMLEEFPLLFGVAKRVYKNLKILADKGFILLSNIGRKKILCFTEKCVEWNRPKTEIKPENGLHETENGRHETENGRHETENGRHETENGLHETENGRHNNNIIDKYTKDNITTDNITTDKDGAKTDFSPEPARTEKQRFSKENGLTPGNLNARQSTIDKIDAAFEQLIFPVDDVEVKRLYFILDILKIFKFIKFSLKYNLSLIQIIPTNSTYCNCKKAYTYM